MPRDDVYVLVVDGKAGNVILGRSHPMQVNVRIPLMPQGVEHQVNMLLSVPQAEAWICALQDAIDRYKTTVEHLEGKVSYGRG